MRVKYTSWTKAIVREKALKYRHRSDFRKNENNAYKCAARNHWLDEVCSHMVKKTKYADEE